MTESKERQVHFPVEDDLTTTHYFEASYSVASSSRASTTGDSTGASSTSTGFLTLTETAFDGVIDACVDTVARCCRLPLALTEPFCMMEVVPDEGASCVKDCRDHSEIDMKNDFNDKNDMLMEEEHPKRQNVTLKKASSAYPFRGGYDGEVLVESSSSNGSNEFKRSASAGPTTMSEFERKRKEFDQLLIKDQDNQDNYDDDDDYNDDDEKENRGNFPYSSPPSSLEEHPESRNEYDDETITVETNLVLHQPTNVMDPLNILHSCNENITQECGKHIPQDCGTEKGAEPFSSLCGSMNNVGGGEQSLASKLERLKCHQPSMICGGDETSARMSTHSKRSSSQYSQQSYVGTFNKAGEKHGFGTCTYSKGDKYVGHFKNNKRCGKGTYYYHNGNIYDGDWKENRRNGKGKFTYKNGDIFDGYFKDCKADGVGQMIKYNPHGKNQVTKGKWKGGKIVSKH